MDCHQRKMLAGLLQILKEIEHGLKTTNRTKQENSTWLEKTIWLVRNQYKNYSKVFKGDIYTSISKNTTKIFFFRNPVKM